MRVRKKFSFVKIIFNYSKEENQNVSFSFKKKENGQFYAFAMKYYPIQ